MSQRHVTLTLTPASLTANGVSLSQKPAGGGVQALTITGSLAAAGVATFDIPRRVGITSDANDSARSFVITGTDRLGRAVTETLVGPNIGVVSTLNDFATVSSITVDANTAGNITAGSSGVVSTQWVPLDRIGVMDVGLAVRQASVANWTIEQSMEGPYGHGVGVQPPGGVPSKYYTPQPHPTMQGQSSNQMGAITTPVSMVRLTINSYTNGASVILDISPGFVGGGF